MAVKTLKIIFRIFFRTLTNHKLIIVNCRSVSVMTAPSSLPYYFNQIWSSWRFHLLAFSNMTSITQDFKKFKIFLDISVLLVTLKSYHIILLTAPIGFKKTFKGSKINFSEKNLWFQMASTFSFRTSLPNWFFPDFVVVFIVIRLIRLIVISY